MSAMGPLTEPKMPDVPGLDRFEGKLMHSARWDHDYDLRGKRVASIGTGASAIQYVPEIQPDVEQLYVFQRTAPWIMPHGNRAITDVERALYRRFPFAQQLVRAGVYASRELLVLGFAKEPRLMRLLERLSRAHMQKQLSDPELLRKVSPDYTIGCKRILPSNRWYPTLAQPNVELIDRRPAGGPRTLRGRLARPRARCRRHHPRHRLPRHRHAGRLPGARRGRRPYLDEVWQGSPRAYLGTSIPGFPNFFMLLGPNTGLGHSSMVYMIESQIEHVRNAIRTIQEARAATIEVRPEAHEAFNRDVDARMQGTVWELGGCQSYYLDRTGRNATLWPDWTWRFRQLATRLDMSAYQLSSPKPAVRSHERGWPGMKAVACKQAKLEVVDLPSPQPAKGQVLIDVLRCGICGSDLHARHHCDELAGILAEAGYDGFMRSDQQVVFGHEFCGEVAEYGPGCRKEDADGHARRGAAAHPARRPGPRDRPVGRRARRLRRAGRGRGVADAAGAERPLPRAGRRSPSRWRSAGTPSGAARSRRATWRS